MSSRSGHLKVARLLCGAGADKDKAVQEEDSLHHVVNPGTWRWPDCPLMMVAQLLCGAGADKDKAEQEDDTALIMASRSGHL